jgi:hypothetical protein
MGAGVAIKPFEVLLCRHSHKRWLGDQGCDRHQRLSSPVCDSHGGAGRKGGTTNPSLTFKPAPFACANLT